MTLRAFRFGLAGAELLPFTSLGFVTVFHFSLSLLQGYLIGYWIERVFWRCNCLVFFTIVDIASDSYVASRRVAQPQV